MMRAMKRNDYNDKKTEMSSDLSYKNKNQIVVFVLDEQHYALLLSAVEQVVRAVEITLLPKAPAVVLGVINVHGQVVPVVDARKRFRLPERAMDLNDRFIIAHTSRWPIALVADSVVEIKELAEQEMMETEETLPFAAYLRGVAKVEGDLVLIYDLDEFFSLDEECGLDAALSEVSDEP
jgi:purine-binding chemotaxis protein CheW